MISKKQEQSLSSEHLYAFNSKKRKQPLSPNPSILVPKRRLVVIDDAISYFIPKDILDRFYFEANQNKNRVGDHDETLALLIGSTHGNKLTATHLLFPNQSGSSTEAGNHGKIVSKSIMFRND